ncbi:MAG: shikimate kinase [Candidatus Pacebacteria bacterium]|nr:shikimate kinase [Candidatus Paceibacterota bacterium]
MKIFLIGPGGVGKTTCGAILANLLGYNFIDLDREFNERIADTSDFIDAYGHKKYWLMNSKLFYEILSQYSGNFVFSLSAGFLDHKNMDELTLEHKRTLKELGISVLLLLSESLDKSMKIVVKRQLLRGFGLTRDREEVRFIQRFQKYKILGDIKIFSYDKPETIAEQMKDRIEIYNKENN